MRDCTEMEERSVRLKTVVKLTNSSQLSCLSFPCDLLLWYVGDRVKRFLLFPSKYSMSEMSKMKTLCSIALSVLLSLSLTGGRRDVERKNKGHDKM